MSTEQCICGYEDFKITATLISCRRCGRVWGRVNNIWVFDYLSAPLGDEIETNNFSALGYHGPDGQCYLCSWVGDVTIIDVVITWPGGDLDTHARHTGLIHVDRGIQPGMVIRVIPKDVHGRDHHDYARHHGGLHAFGTQRLGTVHRQV